MAGFSSEIVKLIHHYLLKEGYEKSAHVLFDECPQLKDFEPVQLSMPLGPSLSDLLKNYFKTKDYVIGELNLLKSFFDIEQESLLILTKKLVENIKYLTRWILTSENANDSTDWMPITTEAGGSATLLDSTFVRSDEGITSNYPALAGHTATSAVEDSLSAQLSSYSSSPLSMVNHIKEKVPLPDRVTQLHHQTLKPLTLQAKTKSFCTTQRKASLFTARPFSKARHWLLGPNPRETGETSNNKNVEAQPQNPTLPVQMGTNPQLTPTMVELLRIVREACNSMNIPYSSQLVNLISSFSTPTPSLPFQEASLNCQTTRKRNHIATALADGEPNNRVTKTSEPTRYRQ